MKMAQVLGLFFVAFILNFIWEEAHRVLYVSYQGGDITQLILLRAALVDAVVITVLFGPLLFFTRGKRFLWISMLLALAFAVGLERFAFATDRWVYQPSMPLVPFLGTGLTPTIQLALLGVLAFYIHPRFCKAMDIPLTHPCE